MIRGLAAHAAVEFRTGVRDRTLLLMTYLFPLGFYCFLGVFMTEMNPDFATVMIPGMTVFAMLAAAMFGLPGPLISARETGVLRSYRINGVPTGSVFGVPAATTVAHLLVVGAIVALSAPVIFEAPRVNNGLAFALVMALAATTHVGLGALIGVVSANTQIMVLWSQLLFLPSVLLAGLIVPLEQVPDGFKSLSLLLPATYAMEAFGGLAFGRAGLRTGSVRFTGSGGGVRPSVPGVVGGDAGAAQRPGGAGQVRASRAEVGAGQRVALTKEQALARIRT